MNGSQQICFTDCAGKALFSIPDNGLLCLFYGNGDRHFAVCHRLDDTHNAFANIYEGRYVAGVVAGMKLQEMIEKS